jgi:Asp-tRNA(Asn)/Glu-tRNA(Gln) amidotransferase A subunit family amidase
MRQPADLLDACVSIATGRCSAMDLLEQALERAHGVAAAAFVRHFDAQARAAAATADLARRSGCPLPPLAGLAVSVKDLFDVAGYPTTGGSRVLAGRPPAQADATAVARLRRAGAALVGHTHMTEFAFSGVGWNPHGPMPANPATLSLDPSTPRIPGGSSSGAAVSVATGAAWAALGSDTGGSIRIPAALQGLVGFKCTARRVPLDGCIPLSPTLDTACAITRSVRDAVRVHEVLADRTVPLIPRPLPTWRLALPRTLMLDDLEPVVAQTFEAAVDRLGRAGARIEDVDLPELSELAALQSRASFAAVESWAWHRELLQAREADYDPRVAQRIRAGQHVAAADYLALQRARAEWIGRVEARIRGFDALVSPTVPCLAPPVAMIAEDDASFFRVNALLLRNPSVVNILDGCAISLPCHRAGDWPVGLMLWAGADSDDTLLNLAATVESALS